LHVDQRVHEVFHVQRHDEPTGGVLEPGSSKLLQM
jgi:hypothetical protein